MSAKIVPWVIPWLVIGFMVVVSVVIMLPSKVVTYGVEAPYIDTEEYIVRIPYEDIEEYTARVPYETKEPYVESIRVEEEERVRYLNEFMECSVSEFSGSGRSTVKIQNVDTERATFTVRIGYRNDSGEFVYVTRKKSISPSSSATFTYSPTPSSFIECLFQLKEQPTKTVVEYREVIKERETTTYRDETRYRKVTKYRNETREREVRKIRFETKEKEVNWLFGFDAIIRFRSLG